MCLVGNRRRSSLLSLTASSFVLGDRKIEKDDMSSQAASAKVLIQPTPMTKTGEVLPTAKRTFDEQESSNQPSYSRQITNSPEPSSYKKRKSSFIEIDEEIKNTTRTSSSAFLLSFPDDADSTFAADNNSHAARPSKRARTLTFRKSTTMMTYESVKSSLFSCDMLPPSIWDQARPTYIIPTEHIFGLCMHEDHFEARTRPLPSWRWLYSLHISSTTFIHDFVCFHFIRQWVHLLLLDLK